MRVLLVDDEAPARARLRRCLADVADVDVVGEADSGDAAVAAIRDLAPDLVLLDIQMPGRDGFGVIEAVGPEAMPPTVFVTAYDEHAIRAFEVRALDYLLKPVRPERLAAAVERARPASRAPSPDDGGTPTAPATPPTAAHAEALRAVLAELGRAAPPLRHVLVQRAGRAILLPVAQIVRVRADRNVAHLHTPDGTYALRTTLAELEARLDPDAFLRLNRGDLVRVSAIAEMHAWSHGDYHVVLHDGTRLVWSRRYRARAGDRFGG